MSYSYYELLKKQAEQWSEAHPNCIPFTSLPRFSEHVTIDRGLYYIVTANSGIGKSRFVKHCFVHNAIEFARHSPIRLKIVFFSLEEGIDRFYLLEICRQLYVRYGIEMDIKRLQSKGISRISGDILEKVRIIEREDLPLLDDLTVLDVRDIHSMNKYVLNLASTYGKIETKRVEYTDGVKEEFSRYICDDDLYVIIIVDHIKLASGGRTIKDTIDTLSSNYMINWKNRFNFIPVAVQQQVASKEAKQFTNKGSLIDSMEPTLDGLGEHKLTQQDADIVLGLYHPYRYKQNYHNGYDISKLKNRYRSATILKSRDGVDDLSVGMHFLGAPGIFSELPRPDSNLISKFYG